MGSLPDKTAVVTGSGRPKGLGEAIARRLAEEGAAIVISDIGASQDSATPSDMIGATAEMEAIAAEIRSLGVSVSTRVCDVRHEDQVSALADHAVEAHGSLDIWVNNAGIGYIMKPLLSVSAGDWRAVIDVNLTGAFFGLQAAARIMIAQGRGGRIVNIASQAAKSGFMHAQAYTASKHGLVGLVRSAAIELGPYGITVNNVCPNHVTTGLGAWQNEYFAKATGKTLDQYMADMAGRIPLGRPGLPEDTANAVAFLCSPEAAYITAESMNVSGRRGAALSAEPAPNPAEALIDHALGLEWRAIPENAQRAARTFLHDSLCVGVAGANAAYAASLRAAVIGWGSGGDCSVLGCPDLRLPATSAAFLNAFQIHAQEFDCVHEAAVVHPLATVAAALMAEAERSGPYSGADFLAALVAGVDVAAGLGVAVTTPVRFFRPATAGIFGSVAALARLRRLPRETALDALGYALAFASGTMQAHVEGKPTLPVQVANAARGAVAALDIALAELPGPRRSIDGPFGYLPLFETGFDLAPVLASLGRIFRITEVSWKPFPTGRAAQGAIVAIQALMRDEGLIVERLESLTYSAPPLIKRLVGRPAIDGMTPAYARLCLPWLTGVVLTKGTVGLEDFSASSLADPVYHRIARRVTVIDNGNPDPAAFVPAEAIARFTDGREVRLPVTAQFGSPSWPLSTAQHLEKARNCLTFGGLERIHVELADQIGVLEHAIDVTPMLKLAGGRMTH